MLKKLSTYFIGFFLSVSIFAYTSDNENSIPEINYSKFTLDNGLTVIVHEDRKVPMVAVNIWYHVGSKDEEGKPGLDRIFVFSLQPFWIKTLVTSRSYGRLARRAGWLSRMRRLP